MTDKPGTPSIEPTPHDRIAPSAAVPGEAAGDFTLRPDPSGLHDPRPHAPDAHPAESASAVKEGLRAAGDRAADLANQARERVTGLASEVHGRLSGAADDARARAGALHQRNMRALDDLTVQGIDGLNRGRTTVERFVDDNPLLVGVVGVAAGLLLGALLPRTRQEDKNLGPWADEMRDQGLRYAREVTSLGREFVQTALDPDNLNAAARKVADTDRPAPAASGRAAHTL